MSRANGITRQEILASIKYKGSMTAEELSNELNISQVAVRQHLTSLEAEGIVAVTIARRGLGRPSHRYTLTAHGDETFPRQYAAFAERMLDALRDWQGDEAVTNLFARQREDYISGLKAQMHDKRLREKLDHLANFQTDNGYMAEIRLSEDPHAFRLVQHNCALCTVARKHPDLCCTNELHMFREVLGSVDITMEKYILDGDATCTFHIRDCGAAGS